MPTTRRRRSRGRIAPLADEARHYLFTGQPADWEGCDPFVEFFVFPTRATQRTVWQTHRDELLPGWVSKSPGTRPWAWWEFDAPRCPSLPGCESDDFSLRERMLPEPRCRCGGIGQPEYEVLNSAPSLPFAVPATFLDSWWVDEEGVNGIAFDPNNPPQFESQATYLTRHGLLATGEARRLRAVDFEPEIVSDEGGRPCRIGA